MERCIRLARPCRVSISILSNGFADPGGRKRASLRIPSLLMAPHAKSGDARFSATVGRSADISMGHVARMSDLSAVARRAKAEATCGAACEVNPDVASAFARG